MKIWEIALDKPLYSTFDYLPYPSNKTPPLYCRVLVPFGKKLLIGLVIKEKTHTAISLNKLKQVNKILDEAPLFSPEIKSLCYFAANYYKQPLGQMLFSALPKYIKDYKQSEPLSVKLNPKQNPNRLISNKPSFQLTKEQQAAINTIKSSLYKFNVFLLDGITGSGKTEVYLQLIKLIIKKNQQILYLIPEINLTPQTISRLEERFTCPIAILHSTLSAKKKAQHWMAAKVKQARIIIGTRSAVFVPANLGLIIIDEEHDLSFKQQNQNQYCAKNLAIIRAKEKQIPIILASATPSFESLANIKKKDFKHLIMRTNPYKITSPHITLIDLKKEKLTHGLTIAAIQLIKQTLLNQQQVLLFINRRGYAPCLMCNHCGWLYRCMRCEKLMTYHKVKAKITCHHCDKTHPFTTQCLHCKTNTLVPIGVGTQRLESHLNTLFPNHPILRVDKDSTQKKDSLNKILANIHTEQPLILIGTQMLAKGHHFKNLSSVIVIDIDMGLHSNDIFATEHLAQLLTQVFGRAGRQHTQGKILLQTYYPEHPMLQLIIKQNYFSYAQHALTERKLANLPPYQYVALLIAQAYKQDILFTFLEQIKYRLPIKVTPNASILGPIAANMHKKQGRFRAYLFIQHKNRTILQKLLTQLISLIPTIKHHTHIHWNLDIDPKEII